MHPDNFPSLKKFLRSGELKHDDGSGYTLGDFFDAHIVYRKTIDRRVFKEILETIESYIPRKARTLESCNYSLSKLLFLLETIKRDYRLLEEDSNATKHL